MPDKHEVGGSSPLGPTNRTSVRRQKCFTEGISDLAESDSSTWANQPVTEPEPDVTASADKSASERFTEAGADREEPQGL